MAVGHHIYVDIDFVLEVVVEQAVEMKHHRCKNC